METINGKLIATIPNDIEQINKNIEILAQLLQELESQGEQNQGNIITQLYFLKNSIHQLEQRMVKLEKINFSPIQRQLENLKKLVAKLLIISCMGFTTLGVLWGYYFSPNLTKSHAISEVLTQNK
jgi:hypothetical protein